MAKRRYQARVCDGDACKDVGKATADFKRAQKRMAREMKRLAKRKFKRLPSGDEGFVAVHGEVWEKEGKNVAGDRPVYVGGEGYGGPRSRTTRRPRRAGPRVADPTG